MKYCYINDEAEKFIYDSDFVRELRWDESVPLVRYIEDYNGEEVVKLSCTQHSQVVGWQEMITDYQRKKIMQKWADFLSAGVLPMKEVQLCTITPQKIFDALCTQTNIESLRIKHFSGKDFSAIRNLTNLKKLFIESATFIEDIAPLGELKNLEVLILGSAKKVTDYSCLGKLKNLKVFIICSYQFRNDRMTMKDDSFIEDMQSLQYLDLRNTRIIHRNFLTEKNAQRFEYACFPVE
ncbi:MAG: leucine-rich repeat domain-containing protein [Lachnospiraceae bacterium]|nr:leucine-rich repeat domain-containing protein [Lachnospiraceae bacterium]